MVKDMHKEQKRLHWTLRSQVNLAKTKLIDISVVTRFASQCHLHISVKCWAARGLSNLCGKLEGVYYETWSRRS